MSEVYEGGSVALVNGAVFTSDPERPRATAVGIWRGRIAYVGDDAQAARAAAGAGAEVIDLAGRTATAGLVEAHCHPVMYATLLRDIDLGPLRSQAEVLAALQERAATTPAPGWIIGRNYYAADLAEGVMPTAAQIEAAVPRRVVVLVHRSGHELTVSPATLALVGYTRDTPDPEGGYLGRNADGALTGLLAENAMHPVNHLEEALASGPEYYRDLLQRASAKFLEYGITSVTEAFLYSPLMMRGYQLLQADRSRPRARYNLMLDHWKNLEPAAALGLTSGFGDRWLRAGAIKFFIDGTEGQRTAKLSEDFSDDPGNTGMWMFPPEEFRERVDRAHRAGWQCAVHAIGDAAIELTLDAYRDAQASCPRHDPRHRVEHASLMRPDLVERFAREGVIPVPGARFGSNDWRVLEPRFGRERLRWYQPWNAWLERNVPVALSSDAPVQSPEPGPNLHAVVTSRAEHDPTIVMQPEERIPLDEALIAYTRNGAYASHQEHEKGMLRPGLLGDVTVFDHDLFALAPDDLWSVKADLTVVDGVVAFRRE